MANYYNVTGYRRTGFNPMNRPFSREVFNDEWFRSPSNYFQVNGIAINRDDMSQITSIRLQGSVKDIKGDQNNEPNSTGAHGPGGPFYSWEEVDYIRLVRTGYPGDEDYVDISGYMDEPWNAPHDGGKLFIGYYFVTGLSAVSRTVTEIYLQMDYWVSLGGAEELEIESGAKVRGHITESEDASSFNLSGESIGLTEPLTTISNGYVATEDKGVYDIIVSAIDLTQYDQSDEIDGFIAQASNGQSVVFPAINAVNESTSIRTNIPTRTGSKPSLITVRDYGFFDVGNLKIKHNMSILYSAGQLELQDSYTVPKQWVLSLTDNEGRFDLISGNSIVSASPVHADIGDYPRKADYMFGQMVIYSLSSGNMNSQPFSMIEDDRIGMWSIPTPNGSPVARFLGIKGHPYEYDQSVSGITWIKKAIVMQGASGSMWSQINAQMNMSELERQRAQLSSNYQFDDRRHFGDMLRSYVNGGFAGLGMISGFGEGVGKSMMAGNPIPMLSESLNGLERASGILFDRARMQTNYNQSVANRSFTDQAMSLREQAVANSLSQSLSKSPFVSFIPDLNAAVFQPNGFGVQVVNTGANDRKRLKDYFKRYGYSGQYKPLTYENINVKRRVNYIEAQDVCIRHEYYPMRVTLHAAQILQNGVFFWNEKPNQEAFNDNPDN